MPATPVSRRDQVNSDPSALEENTKKKINKSVAGSISEALGEEVEQRSKISRIFQFRRRQRRGGTIDVWWLYDDGGNRELKLYYWSYIQFQSIETVSRQ